jgi:hypothetical protein
MHISRIVRAASLLFVGIAATVQCGNAWAQAQRPATDRNAASLELYHVHFVKAAPGKIGELVAAYLDSPVAEGEPGPPLVFRHLQGDDWDLMVLTPLGKEETISPDSDPAQEQWAQRTRPLRSQHADTFTAGPAWAQLRTALAGDSAARATGTSGGTAATANNANVYTVTTYRSIPGHRAQLSDTLRRIAGLDPDRRTILEHVEGAPWEFVVISRFDSWAQLGQDEVAPAETLRKQGFASTEAIGEELRQHVAEHRDTIVRMAMK